MLHLQKILLLKKLTCRYFLLVLSCSLLLPHAVNSEIYKWVDESGKVHFGDKPGNMDAEKVEIKNNHNDDNNYKERLKKQKRMLEIYQEERHEKNQTRAKIKEEKKKRVANCLLAKKQLREINDASFLYEESDDPSNPRILSNEQRLNETKKAEETVKKWCG